jgi:hypothetical protein
MEEGRYGWETYPVRLWSWGRGASQENIDHYYFAITLGHQKVVADFAPTPFDRLMSQGILAKSLDELSAAYHPGLRRFLAPSSRTSLEYLLAKQDGLQYLLHTLSPAGALHDIGNPEVKTALPGLGSVVGEEMPPLRTAMQATTSPWAPAWVTSVIDEKPLPYRAMAVGDGVLTSYLGANYGLATATQSRRIQFLAQWRRAAAPVDKMSELVTVVARYGVNDTRFANDSWGWIAPVGSETYLQHDNKALMLASPISALLRERASKEGIRSLQTSVAFFNYQPSPSWEIYVDGARVTELPFTTHAGAKIAVHDGVSYFGVVALPATDLGGGNAVVLREGTPQEWNKITFTPALVIDSYNLRRDEPLHDPDWARIDNAFSGFAFEIGDSADYPSFDAFRDHLAHTDVRVRNAEPGTVVASFKSGDDILATRGTLKDDELRLMDASINGHDAFPPPGVLRDTTTSIQGTLPTLEKAGAVLRGEQGHMKFLQVEPRSGTFVAWNPLPDLTKFSLSLPGGARIEADGRIGLAEVEVIPHENRVVVNHAWRDGQDQDRNAASAFVLFDFSSPQSVVLNGIELTQLTTRRIGNPLTASASRGCRGSTSVLCSAASSDGHLVYLVPLRDTLRPDVEIERALRD